MANVVSFLILLCLNTVLASSVVRIDQGSVKGLRDRSRLGKKFLAFRGIPYAEPPLGDLRFRSPVPKKPWNGTFKAYRNGPACIQITERDKLIGSEDCLYLNVHTPRVNLSENNLLPVVVYIHGGGFVVGDSGDALYGPGYFLDKDIVFVTMNYRIGPLGFLSTGDLLAPGNFGLKDQLLALKWVQQNIEAFGGDRHRVTLFGHSAGASCVHLHTLSPKSKHLFNQTILESGFAYSPWAFRTRITYYDYSRKLAERLNCPIINTYYMLECLRKQKAVDLITISPSIFDYQTITMIRQWGPTVEPKFEDAFITDTPTAMMRKDQDIIVPTIFGIVKDEGYYLSSKLYENETLLNMFNDNPLDAIIFILSFYEPLYDTEMRELAIKLKHHYFHKNMPRDRKSVALLYSDIITDVYFFYPFAQFQQYMMRKTNKPFYNYFFAYRGVLSTTSLSTNNNMYIAVSHADELLYQFPRNGSDVGLSENLHPSPDDHKVITLMTDLWTSCAEKGYPDLSGFDDKLVWKPYQSEESYLVIGNASDPTIQMKNHLISKKMKFYFENVPQFPFYENTPKYPTYENVPEFPNYDNVPEFPNSTNAKKPTSVSYTFNYSKVVKYDF